MADPDLLVELARLIASWHMTADALEEAIFLSAADDPVGVKIHLGEMVALTTCAQQLTHLLVAEMRERVAAKDAK